MSRYKYPYQDPNSDGNSEKHRTGKPCIEAGCSEPAGTAWSKHWCVKHNIERMDRINKSMGEIWLMMRSGSA